MKKKKKLAWTTKAPQIEGWYWYRSGNKIAVLHCFDPMFNGVFKAWDFHNGRMQLCAIQNYTGEWYGPINPPS